MIWLAHSAKRDCPAQTYRDHIVRAVSEARRMATEATLGLPHAEIFAEMVALATEFHDMGKLDDDNQRVLAAPTGKPLPCEHVDAGVKHLFGLGSHTASFAGMLAYSHHRGLPNVPVQQARPPAEKWRGDENSQRFLYAKIIARTSANLPEYLRRHQEALQTGSSKVSSERYAPTTLDLRMGLSCLADADHGDTARHYGRPLQDAPKLLASDRLAVLDAYVSSLAKQKWSREEEKIRAEARQALYATCRSANTSPAIYACDSPVGSGKTTAVMAHLLRAAADKGLRRIFVVLPYTNIIDQSVKTYRDALCLNGEAAEQVVAAHHHKSDFSDPLTRELTTRWHTPVVVTTAVQFFETLANQNPSDLRKLHRVARSAIFIDEAHAALPAHLWPLAWKWLRCLAEKWGCHIVLGSGSLARFWSLPDFYEKKRIDGKDFPQKPIELPNLANTEVQLRLTDIESRRVEYRLHSNLMGLDALVDFIGQLPGPRLVVLNTVQTAAMVAKAIAAKWGQDKVEHLSTALTPDDRLSTLACIQARLNCTNDHFKGDWALVATSLVEAGVDLSFRSGVRELSGLANLLQLSGRVNRHGEHDCAEVWSIKLDTSCGLKGHARMKIPAGILTDMYAKKQVDSAHCTEALRREIREQSNNTLIDTLFQAEHTKDYPTVSEKFKVIDSETVTALVPGHVLDAIRLGLRPDWHTLQMHCVQIWANRKLDFALTEMPGYPGLYAWNLEYDGFIGYMRGALKADQVKSGAVQIV